MIDNSNILETGIALKSYGPSTAFINNSILFQNQTDVVNFAPSFVSIDNSLMIYAEESNSLALNNVLQGNPMLNDDYSLNEFSPCIDSGHPDMSDQCSPPGLGGSRSDIGMYGGPSNCGAWDSNTGCMDSSANNYDEDALLDDGSCDYSSAFASPSIQSIVDIPEDQVGS